MGGTSARGAWVRGGSFLLGLAFNALLLMLIARFDTTVRPDIAPAPVIVPVDLSQLVLPPRAAPLILRRPALPKATRKAETTATRAAVPQAASSPEPSPVAALQPAGPPASLAPGAPDDATRAKVSTALRSLTGCSMISGPDDDATRERCRRAFTQADVAGVAIDTVPEEKRTGYDGAVALDTYRRNVTPEGVAMLGRGGVAHDKGHNINVRYGCWMKVGPSATPKLHCPGVM